jgi:hypothetical protein
VLDESEITHLTIPISFSSLPSSSPFTSHRSERRLSTVRSCGISSSVNTERYRELSPLRASLQTHDEEEEEGVERDEEECGEEKRMSGK